MRNFGNSAAARGVAVICAVLFEPCSLGQNSWVPALWQQGAPQIKLLPLDGDEVVIPLSAVVKSLADVSFNPDGKALYGRSPQFPLVLRSPYIKIEFRPLRENVVAG
jgi:hypothetical protein